ncbi:uncharacterized protein LOC143548734 [Bidens hawaiensis]|uniref:uncharacterized protein LOC143548734 n=1 Tax=Bidens hawaiensis TaxID=980011 RepID=UPI00404B9984
MSDNNMHKRIKDNLETEVENAYNDNELKKVDDKIEESIDRVQDLKQFLHGKEKELETLRIENQEKEIKLEKKAKEVVNIQETLTEKLKEKASNEEGLVEERNILKEHVKDLEIKIETLSNDTRPAPVKDLSNKMKSLQQKFESLEVDKRELEGKNDGDTLVNRLSLEPKSSLQTTIKKMGDMVDEFRKKTEDSYRILNRRVCVSEQLNNETRNWYKNTLEKHEQDKKDSDLAIHNIKIIMPVVSETLSVSETFGLRFVECCEEFTNRVSKVSCEMNFVKDWVKRKNGELIQVKEDFDALVVQMDGKEEEILWSRQKALRLENKLRDLEKIVKENDEAMIVLKEEKREAIRQLCVWIDHHRGLSDFLKKAFFELAARCQRAC